MHLTRCRWAEAMFMLTLISRLVTTWQNYRFTRHLRDRSSTVNNQMCWNWSRHGIKTVAESCRSITSSCWSVLILDLSVQGAEHHRCNWLLDLFFQGQLSVFVAFCAPCSFALRQLYVIVCLTRTFLWANKWQFFGVFLQNSSEDDRELSTTHYKAFVDLWGLQLLS